jgi:hypothetical protein
MGIFRHLTKFDLCRLAEQNKYKSEGYVIGPHKNEIQYVT